MASELRVASFASERRPLAKGVHRGCEAAQVDERFAGRRRAAPEFSASEIERQLRRAVPHEDATPHTRLDNLTV